MILSLNLSGGGFDSGASSDPKIDGTYMAAKVGQSMMLWYHALNLVHRALYSRATITGCRSLDSLMLQKLQKRTRRRTLVCWIVEQPLNGYTPMSGSSEETRTK